MDLGERNNPSRASDIRGTPLLSVEGLNDVRTKLASFQHPASGPLDVLVQIDAKKHPKKAEEVDF
jgi:hypothetical protein